jgi:hypothetical protein
MIFREYYQYDDNRLGCCLSVFHGLLHVVRSVRDCGPPFVYWQYPMERFCGICLPFIKSKRNPYSNLVKNIFRKQHLTLLQYLPYISLSADGFEQVDENMDNRCFKYKIGSTTIQLKSPKSKDLQDISLSDQKLLIQYYFSLETIEKNAIVLQKEAKRLQKEIAEVCISIILSLYLLSL